MNYGESKKLLRELPMTLICFFWNPLKNWALQAAAASWETCDDAMKQLKKTEKIAI
ncbi:hypothetical protein C1H46_029367 [Malus baccata]|uniref:Uncharacterized protein n=1 Tax=Malus baccata TaxID=106549 RepID=A0A540LF33_MALBA|nr:hypothetical protein C1H46_029367 [Malus baccata]